MKLNIILLTYLILFVANAQKIVKEDPQIEEVIHSVDGAPSTLFSECKNFYDKFGSTDKDDIFYTSSKMLHVPAGKYAYHLGVKNEYYGKPQLLLIGKITAATGSKEFFLICIIYPYPAYSDLDYKFLETQMPGWIQGHRRFDAWTIDTDGKWKVQLGIDLNRIQFNHDVISNDIGIFDTSEPTILAISSLKSGQESIEKIIKNKLLEKNKK